MSMPHFGLSSHGFQHIWSSIMDFIKSGYLASIPFLAARAEVILSGILSDYLIKKEKSVGVACKTPVIVGLIISVCIVGANYTNDTFLIIFFMAVAFFGAGMAFISWVFVSHKSSPQKLYPWGLDFTSIFTKICKEIETPKV